MRPTPFPSSLIRPATTASDLQRARRGLAQGSSSIGNRGAELLRTVRGTRGDIVGKLSGNVALSKPRYADQTDYLLPFEFLYQKYRNFVTA